MKILYDYQMFNTQNVGGITRYFYELINDFDKDDDISWEIPIQFSSNLYLNKHPRFKDKLAPNPIIFKNNKSLLSKIKFVKEKVLYKVNNTLHHDQYYGIEYIKDKNVSIRKLKEGNFDVFHPTYFDDYFMEHLGDKPFVLTVHDLINQVFPEISLHHPIDKNQAMITRANRIITVSESTKRDLINIFDVDEEKIDVIHLSNPLDSSIEQVTEEFRSTIPEKYILYIGGRWDYKNFLFFAQMFSSLLRDHSNLKVVCTGSPFNAQEKYLLNKLNLRDSFHNSFVSDTELSYLYKNAVAFIFPSLYEGFGLPILEAFSCGCPVLASNNSSLTEVGGEAALYFEPKNPGSLLNALNTILTNSEVRENNIEKGYKQLEKFSWQKTAALTKQTYIKALAG